MKCYKNEYFKVYYWTLIEPIVSKAAMSDLPFPELENRIGEEVLVSEWVRIDQDSIDRFAEATGDHQWIHVDRERAARESPFGTTIAHGYMTLALLPRLMAGFLEKVGPRQVLNYGCEKVRFPAPVPVGSRVRARFTLKEVAPGQMGSLRCTLAATVEIEGGERPACVADGIFLLFP